MAQKLRSFFPIPSSGNNPTSLPVSHKTHEGGGGGGLLRRRLSSVSLNCKIEAGPRSESLSSMGDYAGTSIRKWWNWGWTWILSRKPIFARDLEMNEQETKILGSHGRGTWRHVFYKLRSLISSDTLPQTYNSSARSN